MTRVLNMHFFVSPYPRAKGCWLCSTRADVTILITIQVFVARGSSTY